MQRVRHAVLGGVALLVGVGMISQSPIYASVSGAPQKKVLAKEVNEKYVFSPAKTTVAVGTKVTWANSSDAPHTVTSKTKGWKFDKPFNKNKVSFVFTKKGTYKYYCKYHLPGMVATITVK